MSLDVRVEQNIGKKRVNGKLVEVAHPVDRVWVDGQFIGYIARMDGAKLCPLRRMGDQEAEPILRKIAELRKDDFTAPAGVGVAPPPPEKAQAAWDAIDAQENDEETEIEDDDE